MGEGEGNFMSRRLSTAGYTHAHGSFIQLTPGVLLLYAIVRSRLNGSRESKCTRGKKSELRSSTVYTTIFTGVICTPWKQNGLEYSRLKSLPRPLGTGYVPVLV